MSGSFPDFMIESTSPYNEYSGSKNAPEKGMLIGDEFCSVEPISSGKTKRILRITAGKHSDTSTSDLVGKVVMVEGDQITAGDGVRKETLRGKGALSATITSNVMEHLASEGIPTHFIKKVGKNMILAEECEMIPVECVFRFVNTGSYQKRKGGDEGAILEEPVIELFYKNDVIDSHGNVISDPLIMTNENGEILLNDEGGFRLAYPGNPNKNKGHKDGSFQAGDEITYTRVTHPSPDGGKTPGKDMDWGTEYLKDVHITCENGAYLQTQTLKVGLKSREFYRRAGVEVLDGKVEFGKLKNKPDALPVLADVVDGDSYRIRSVLVVEGVDGRMYLTKPYAEMDGADRAHFDENREKLGNLNEIGVLPAEMEIKRIMVERGLDKQGYREGESTDTTIIKYNELAERSTVALKKSKTVGSVTEQTQAAVTETLDYRGNMLTPESEREIITLLKSWNCIWTSVSLKEAREKGRINLLELRRDGTIAMHIFKPGCHEVVECKINKPLTEEQMRTIRSNKYEKWGNKDDTGEGYPTHQNGTTPGAIYAFHRVMELLPGIEIEWLGYHHNPLSPTKGYTVPNEQLEIYQK